MKHYESRVISIQEMLMQSSTALKLELEKKDGMFAHLTQERDTNVKWADVLKLELEVMESKLKVVRLLEASLKMQISNSLFHSEQQWSEIDSLKTKLRDECCSIESIKT